jgi:RNA polymerase sigma factor (sigma-70 family)
MSTAQATAMSLPGPFPWVGQRWPGAGGRSNFRRVPVSARTSDATDAALLAEEARLARAAADGDGQAFATLYERYESRAYNLAYRLSGSEDDAADATQEAFLNVMKRLPSLRDRELAFGSYVFTATRNACYDLMSKRKRAQPSDAIPESAAPIGSGAGGMGLDPGDPEDDPARKLLLESQQDEIRAANARLPERQREVLALRELEGLSYDEIAETMEMNRNSVAQLISRARIKLRDELRGTALASIAVSSADCERALPLLAMRDDGQLEDGSADAAWLDSHVTGCDTCKLSIEAMQEAGTSYRAWTPIAAAPWLFEATMAKAAELAGADWSDTIAERSAARTAAFEATSGGGRRRRRIIAAAALGIALLVTAATTVLGDDDVKTTPPEPTVNTVETAPIEAEKPDEKTEPKRKHKRKAAKQDSATPSSEPSDPETFVAPTGGGPSSQTQDTPRQRPEQPAGDPPAGDPPAAEDPSPPPVVDEPPVIEEPPPPPPDQPCRTCPPVIN